MNKINGMSLVIAVFDTKSDEPYLYACGIPTQDIHNCGGFPAGMVTLITDRMANDPDCEDENLDGFTQENLTTYMMFDCLNDLPRVISNDRHEKCEYIGDVSNTGLALSSQIIKKGIIPSIELLVGQCDCGYHFTVDHTFVEQIGDFKFNCPACGNAIDTAEVFPE